MTKGREVFVELVITAVWVHKPPILRDDTDDTAAVITQVRVDLDIAAIALSNTSTVSPKHSFDLH